MRERGEFEMVEEEDAVVAEILAMLKILDGASGRLVSDHDRNLLVSVEGHLTDDNAAMQALCETLLALPPKTRDAYIVARRSGFFLTLQAFQNDPEAVDRFTPKPRSYAP